LITPVKVNESSDLFVSFSTLNSFVDASGKLNDHSVVSFGCVAAFAERDTDFAMQWNSLLGLYGVKSLHAMDVLNYNRPLSQKNACLGIGERTIALNKFVSCIRGNLQLILGYATDVAAFRRLPPHFFQVFGTDPAYITFIRVALEVLDFCPPRSKVTMICDDDEETALDFYRLYRRIKKVLPQARHKMAAISFIDDRYLFAVQASDLVAAMMRLEAGRRINGEGYDYQPVYDALFAPPEKHERFLMAIGTAVADQEQMKGVAEGLREIYENKIREGQQRIREVRPSHGKAIKRVTRTPKGQTGGGEGGKEEAQTQS
jgi:hypothetical protein